MILIKDIIGMAIIVVTGETLYFHMLQINHCLTNKITKMVVPPGTAEPCFANCSEDGLYIDSYKLIN